MLNYFQAVRNCSQNPTHFALKYLSFLKLRLQYFVSAFTVGVHNLVKIKHHVYHRR